MAESRKSWPGDRSSDLPKISHRIVNVNTSGLRKLNTRPSFWGYLAQLWGRRYFILADARLRAFRTAKSYRLWQFWLVAQPLLDAAMYGLIFGLLLKTSRGVDNFIGFLVLGVTYFGLLTSLVAGGQSLLQTSKNLMQAFSFPRAALVLSQSFRYLIDTAPALIVSTVFALGAQWDTPISWKVTLAVPLTVLMWIFGTGLMFIVARITAFIPDFKVVVNLAVRAWFFGSGVFFSLERFAETPELYRVLSINPGYLFLKSLRECVLYDTIPAASTWAYLIIWAIGLFTFGLLFFWLAEERYVDVRS